MGVLVGKKIVDFGRDPASSSRKEAHKAYVGYLKE